MYSRDLEQERKQQRWDAEGRLNEACRKRFSAGTIRKAIKAFDKVGGEESDLWYYTQRMVRDRRP